VEEFTMAANIKTEVIDELLASCSSASDLFDNNGLFKQLKKQLVERLLAHVSLLRRVRRGRVVDFAWLTGGFPRICSDRNGPN
jgi:hypothetical protein